MELNYIFIIYISICTNLINCDENGLNPLTIEENGHIANEDSTITWSDLPASNDSTYTPMLTYESGSLAALYSMAEGFINLVIPFNEDWLFKSLAHIMDNGVDISYFTNDFGSLASNFAGIVIIVLLCLGYAFLVPLVGLFFFCCRCCGNCGGKGHEKSPDKSNMKRIIYGTIVFFLSIFISTGAFCTYDSTSRLSTNLGNVSTNIVGNIDNLENFIESVMEEIKYVAGNGMAFTTKVISRDLDNIDYLVGRPLKDKLNKNGQFDELFDSMADLDDGSQNLTHIVTQFEQNLQDLETAINSVTTDLSNVDTTLQNKGAGSLDLEIATDTAEFTTISSKMTEIKSNIDTVNMTELINEGKSIISGIPGEVKVQATDPVVSVKKLLNNFTDTIPTMIDDASSMLDNLTESTDQFKNSINENMNNFDEYFAYSKYAGLIPASFSIITVGFMVIGLCCGCCGHNDSSVNPVDRSRISHCGYICLMVATYFIFFLTWICGLIILILFVLGAPIERYFCQGFQYPNWPIIKGVIDNPDINPLGSVGEMLFGNDSIDLSFESILISCKENEPIYQAIKLGELIDIDTIVDYKSSIDIENLLEGISIPNQKILTQEVEDNIGTLQTSLGYDFTSLETVFTDLKTEVAMDTEGKAQDIDDNNGSSDTDLTQAANTLRGMKNSPSGSLYILGETLDEIISTFSELKANISDLSTSLSTVLNQTKFTDKYMSDSLETLVRDEINVFVERVFYTADQFVKETKRAFKEDIGKSRPIWNMWQSLIIDTLCHSIIQTFNGMWFSLGWSVGFMFLALIFNVKLARRYRRFNSCGDRSSPGFKPSNRTTPLP